MPMAIQALKLLAFTLLIACQTTVRQQQPEWSNYFQARTLSDTLRIEVDTRNNSQGDTIPNALFFKSIPPELLHPISHIADTVEATVLGRGSFPLAKHITAYWVEFRLMWFQQHSLLLYDEAQKAFTDRISVAEWYGGDGGQMLLGSWLFDYDGDGTRDLVRIEMEHSLIPTDDVPLEKTEASASLLLWKNGRFVDTPVQDTAMMVRRFPIRHFW